MHSGQPDKKMKERVMSNFLPALFRVLFLNDLGHSEIFSIQREIERDEQRIQSARLQILITCDHVMSYFRLYNLK